MELVNLVVNMVVKIVQLKILIQMVLMILGNVVHVLMH